MKFTDYIYCRDKKSKVYQYVVDCMNASDRYGNKVLAILSSKPDDDIVCFIFPYMEIRFNFVCGISFDWCHMCVECHWYVSEGNGFVARVYMNGLTSKMFVKWFIDSTESFIELSSVMKRDIL